jgi:hypothetical protein
MNRTQVYLYAVNTETGNVYQPIVFDPSGFEIVGGVNAPINEVFIAGFVETVHMEAFREMLFALTDRLVEATDDHSTVMESLGDQHHKTATGTHVVIRCRSRRSMHTIATDLTSIPVGSKFP